MDYMNLIKLISCVGLAGAGLLGCAGAAPAVTYYVDAQAGSDRNAGTDPNAPWQHCPGMAAYGGAGALRPGDTVYFNRGQTWGLSGPQGLYLTGGVTYRGDAWGSGSAKAHLQAT